MRVNEAHLHGPRRSRKKRVGRGPGTGNGKFAGKGMNGSRSRSGYAAKRGYEGGQMPLFRRLPKRGFSNARFRKDYAVVNVADLKKFDADGTVGPAELFAKGLIDKLGEAVKVLGDGEVDRALTVRAHKFSKAAAEKIEKAGGKAEVISG
jgi:large subunit ribosomal protein L15